LSAASLDESEVAELGTLIDNLGSIALEVWTNLPKQATTTPTKKRNNQQPTFEIQQQQS
jgi:hypothetical protein